MLRSHGLRRYLGLRQSARLKQPMSCEWAARPHGLGLRPRPIGSGHPTGLRPTRGSGPRHGLRHRHRFRRHHGLWSPTWLLRPCGLRRPYGFRPSYGLRRQRPRRLRRQHELRRPQGRNPWDRRNAWGVAATHGIVATRGVAATYWGRRNPSNRRKPRSCRVRNNSWDRRNPCGNSGHTLGVGTPGTPGTQPRAGTNSEHALGAHIPMAHSRRISTHLSARPLHSGPLPSDTPIDVQSELLELPPRRFLNHARRLTFVDNVRDRR